MTQQAMDGLRLSVEVGKDDRHGCSAECHERVRHTAFPPQPRFPMASGCSRLLDRHRDPDAFFVGDQVVVVVEAGVELNPLDLAVEAA